MISLLTELEMRCIDSMPRHQLIEAIRGRWEFLPADLRLRIEEQSIDRLRLILLAVRLMYFLRNSKNPDRVVRPELN
ncbi:MAG TPA: hypothetical protein VGZ25_04260 [Gemmataceae bacterium]|jgi:hypothetical protein|nr:hypothetical protein [Gemmataceae bacterium]